MRKTPKEIVELLNDEYYIPSIQRRFVWEKEQISMIFDSILRDFPIGQMLVKTTDIEEISNRPTYKFVTEYVKDDVADFTKGHHNNPQIGKIESNPVKLVFDGQQRLTAINIGLNGGIYERDNKYKSKREKNYVKKILCMNLISNPDELIGNAESFDQSKGGEAPKYEFAFRTPEEFGWDEENRSYWYRVSDITAFDDITGINEFINDSDIPNSESTKAINNLMQLHEKTHRSNCIDIKSVKNKDSDEMLEIFLRMNRSGTQISDTDTALSIMTYKWQNENNNLVAREVIEDYVSHINQKFDKNRNPMSEKTMVQMLRVCSTPKSNVDSFRPNIKIDELTDKEGNLPDSMRKVWISDDFRKAVSDYIKICRDFDIPTGRIGSTVVFAPVILYLYSRDNVKLDPEINEGLLNRQKILYWIASSVSLGLASFATSRHAKNATKSVFKSSCETFPLIDMVESVESEVSLEFSQNALESSEIKTDFYSDMRSEFLLKLMHIHRFSRQEYATKSSYDKDHIFPRNSGDSEELERLGNIQYIKSSTNKSKRDDDFESWIENTTDNYRRNHYIPNLGNYEINNIGNFVEEREKLITKVLRKLYNHLTEKSEPIQSHPNKIFNSSSKF